MGTFVSQILSVAKIWPEEVNAFSSLYRILGNLYRNFDFLQK